MNIFSNFQFGFSKTHSISHACPLLTSKITESFNSKQKIFGIFLDLSEALTPLIIQFYFQNFIITLSEAYLCNGSKAVSKRGNYRSKLITFYQQKFILSLMVFHKTQFSNLYCFCFRSIIFLIF